MYTKKKRRYSKGRHPSSMRIHSQKKTKKRAKRRLSGELIQRESDEKRTLSKQRYTTKKMSDSHRQELRSRIQTMLNMRKGGTIFTHRKKRSTGGGQVKLVYAGKDNTVNILGYDIDINLDDLLNKEEQLLDKEELLSQKEEQLVAAGELGQEFVTRNGELEQENEALLEANSDLQAIFGEKEHQIGELEDKSGRLEENNEYLSSTTTKLQEDLDTVNAELQKLQSGQPSREESATIEKLQTIIARMERENQELKATADKVKELTNDITQLKGKVEGQESARIDAQRELRDMKLRVDTIRALNTDIKELEQRKLDLESNTTTLDTGLASKVTPILEAAETVHTYGLQLIDILQRMDKLSPQTGGDLSDKGHGEFVHIISDDVDTVQEDVDSLRSALVIVDKNGNVYDEFEDMGIEQLKELHRLNNVELHIVIVDPNDSTITTRTYKAYHLGSYSLKNLKSEPDFDEFSALAYRFLGNIGAQNVKGEFNLRSVKNTALKNMSKFDKKGESVARGTKKDVYEIAMGNYGDQLNDAIEVLYNDWITAMYAVLHPDQRKQIPSSISNLKTAKEIAEEEGQRVAKAEAAAEAERQRVAAAKAAKRQEAEEAAAAQLAAQEAKKKQTLEKKRDAAIASKDILLLYQLLPVTYLAPQLTTFNLTTLKNLRNHAIKLGLYVEFRGNEAKGTPEAELEADQLLNEMVKFLEKKYTGPLKDTVSRAQSQLAEANLSDQSKNYVEATKATKAVREAKQALLSAQKELSDAQEKVEEYTPSIEQISQFESEREDTVENSVVKLLLKHQMEKSELVCIDFVNHILNELGLKPRDSEVELTPKTITFYPNVHFMRSSFLLLSGIELDFTKLFYSDDAGLAEYIKELQRGVDKYKFTHSPAVTLNSLGLKTLQWIRYYLNGRNTLSGITPNNLTYQYASPFNLDDGPSESRVFQGITSLNEIRAILLNVLDFSGFRTEAKIRGSLVAYLEGVKQIIDNYRSKTNDGQLKQFDTVFKDCFGSPLPNDLTDFTKTIDIVKLAENTMKLHTYYSNTKNYTQSKGRSGSPFTDIANRLFKESLTPIEAFMYDIISSDTDEITESQLDTLVAIFENHDINKELDEITESQLNAMKDKMGELEAAKSTLDAEIVELNERLVSTPGDKGAQSTLGYVKHESNIIEKELATIISEIKAVEKRSIQGELAEFEADKQAVKGIVEHLKSIKQARETLTLGDLAGIILEGAPHSESPIPYHAFKSAIGKKLKESVSNAVVSLSPESKINVNKLSSRRDNLESRIRNAYYNLSQDKSQDQYQGRQLLNELGVSGEDINALLEYSQPSNLVETTVIKVGSLAQGHDVLKATQEIPVERVMASLSHSLDTTEELRESIEGTIATKMNKLAVDEFDMGIYDTMLKVFTAERDQTPQPSTPVKTESEITQTKNSLEEAVRALRASIDKANESVSTQSITPDIVMEVFQNTQIVSDKISEITTQYLLPNLENQESIQKLESLQATVEATKLDLEGKIQGFQKERAAFEAEKSKFQEDQRNFKSDQSALESGQRALESGQSELESRKADLKRKQKLLDEKRKQVELQVDIQNKAHDEEIKTLKEQLEASKQLTKDKQQEISKLTEEIEGINAELDTLTGENDALKVGLADAVTSLLEQVGENATLNEQLKQLQESNPTVEDIKTFIKALRDISPKSTPEGIGDESFKTILDQVLEKITEILRRETNIASAEMNLKNKEAELTETVHREVLGKGINQTIEKLLKDLDPLLTAANMSLRDKLSEIKQGLLNTETVPPLPEEIKKLIKALPDPIQGSEELSTVFFALSKLYDEIKQGASNENNGTMMDLIKKFINLTYRTLSEYVNEHYGTGEGNTERNNIQKNIREVVNKVNGREQTPPPSQQLDDMLKQLSGLSDFLTKTNFNKIVELYKQGRHLDLDKLHQLQELLDKGSALIKSVKLVDGTNGTDADQTKKQLEQLEDIVEELITIIVGPGYEVLNTNVDSLLKSIRKKKAGLTQTSSETLTKTSQRLGQLEEARKSADQRQSGIEDRINILNTQMNEYKGLIADLNTQLADKEILQDERDKLRGKLIELILKMQEDSLQMKTLEEHIDDVVKYKEGVNSRVLQLVEGLDLNYTRNPGTSDDQEIIDLLDKLLEMKARMFASPEEVNQPILELATKNKELVQSDEGLLRKIGKLEAELQAAKAAKQAAEAAKQAEINEVTAKLAEANQNLDTKTAELNTTREKLSEFGSKFIGKNSELNSLQTKHKQLQEEHEKQVANYKAQEKDIAKLRQQLAEAPAQAGQQGQVDQSQVDSLNQQIQDLQQRLTKAQAERAAQAARDQAALAAKDQKIQQLTTQLNALQQQLGQGQVQDQEINRLKSQIASAETNLNGITITLQQIRAGNQQLQAENETLTQQNTDLQDALQRLQTTASNTTQAATVVHRTVSERFSIKDTLCNSLMELSRRIPASISNSIPQQDKQQYRNLGKHLLALCPVSG